MRRLVFLLALVAGCDGNSVTVKQAAKPVNDQRSEKVIAVAAAKPASTSPEAKTAIDKLLAVHTTNNVAALTAFRNCIVRRSGEMDQGETLLPAECVDRFAWPDRYRADWTFMNSMTIFAVGDVVRFLTAAQVEPQVLDAAQTTSSLEDIRAQWMTMLVPLLDTSRILAAVVNDTPDGTTGLRVWVDEQPPLVLLIDAKTGLLDRVVFEKSDEGRRETWTFKLSDYKTTRGVQLPSKVVFTPGRRAGATWSKVEYEPTASFPAGTFEKR